MRCMQCTVDRRTMTRTGLRSSFSPTSPKCSWCATMCCLFIVTKHTWITQVALLIATLTAADLRALMRPGTRRTTV